MAGIRHQTRRQSAGAFRYLIPGIGVRGRRDARTAAPNRMAGLIAMDDPGEVSGAQLAPVLPPGPRKEVIQPQVPLRLPCYDFAPVADLTVVGCLPSLGQRTGFG
jgi:hypothetical protein